MPERKAAAGLCVGSGCVAPSSVNVPDSAFEAPNMTYGRSSKPEPDNPVTPRISPRWTVKEASAMSPPRTPSTDAAGSEASIWAALL